MGGQKGGQRPWPRGGGMWERERVIEELACVCERLLRDGEE
jgi:hypothetical protein